MSEQSNKYIVKNQKSLSAAVKKLTFFGPSIIFFGPPDIKTSMNYSSDVGYTNKTLTKYKQRIWECE